MVSTAKFTHFSPKKKSDLQPVCFWASQIRYQNVTDPQHCLELDPI
jgi:hypothetical protein